MKGVVIVGGEGTRLRPFTLAVNKHILPVGPVPMFFWPVRALASAGVTEAMIVCGGKTPGAFMEMAGSELCGVRLTYGYQGKPQGIADALRVAEDFVAGEDCLLLLGDTILDAPLLEWATDFDAQGYGARMLLQAVPDPERCGVVEWEEDACGEPTVARIVEKPVNPPSHDAVLGAYCFDGTVWDDLARMRPSERGQYEVTDLLQVYLMGGALGWGYYAGQYADAGTMEGYRRANEIGWETTETWASASY
jgi:glucose-1-phosphate thymidylyltransferase